MLRIGRSSDSEHRRRKNVRKYHFRKGWVGPVATHRRVLGASPSRRSAYAADGASAGVTGVEDCIPVSVALASDSIVTRQAAMLYVGSGANNAMP